MWKILISIIGLSIGVFIGFSPLISYDDSVGIYLKKFRQTNKQTSVSDVKDALKKGVITLVNKEENYIILKEDVYVGNNTFTEKNIKIQFTDTTTMHKQSEYFTEDNILYFKDISYIESDINSIHTGDNIEVQLYLVDNVLNGGNITIIQKIYPSN